MYVGASLVDALRVDALRVDVLRVGRQGSHKGYPYEMVDLYV